MMIKMKQIFLLFVLLLLMPIQGWCGQTLLRYQAYGAGLNLMTAEMGFDVSDRVFRAQSIAETKGMLRILLNAQSVFYSEGKIQNNQFVDDNSYIETLTKNKHKKRVIDLKDKQNFVDYQTALLQMMYSDMPQDKTFKVYDGKREMILTFDYQKQVVLAPEKNVFYSGPADYYTLTIDITKGKKKGWFFNRMGNKKNPPLHLYFALVKGISPKLMVKGAFDTALFGTISIHLNHVSIQGGEK